MNRDLVRRVSVSLAAGVLAAAVVGCGGDAAHRQNVTVVHRPWTELGAAALNVTGGSAASAGGVGAAGGAVHLVARGNVSIDSASSSAAGVQVPAAPAGATKVATDALAEDVSVAGDIRVTGDTASGGADAMRDDHQRGRRCVRRRRRTRRQSRRRAPGDRGERDRRHGLRHRNDRAPAAPQTRLARAIRITARRIVITGKLLAAGGDSPAAGGAAGAISMVASETVTISGVIETFGGNAVGGAAVTGGAAASLVIQAGGDVAVGGTTLARGGAATTTASADAHGGAAGELRIDADGAVRIAGTFDARGGMAKAAGGAVLGGAAGGVHVGEAAAPSDIGLLAPIVAAGGDGDSAGGQGGTVAPEPDTGDVIIAGTRGDRRRRRRVTRRGRRGWRR